MADSIDDVEAPNSRRPDAAEPDSGWRLWLTLLALVADVLGAFGAILHGFSGLFVALLLVASGVLVVRLRAYGKASGASPAKIASDGVLVLAVVLLAATGGYFLRAPEETGQTGASDQLAAASGSGSVTVDGLTLKVDLVANQACQVAGRPCGYVDFTLSNAGPGEFAFCGIGCAGSRAILVDAQGRRHTDVQESGGGHCDDRGEAFKIPPGGLRLVSYCFKSEFPAGNQPITFTLMTDSKVYPVFDLRLAKS